MKGRRWEDETGTVSQLARISRAVCSSEQFRELDYTIYIYVTNVRPLDECSVFLYLPAIISSGERAPSDDASSR